MKINDYNEKIKAIKKTAKTFMQRHINRFNTLKTPSQTTPAYNPPFITKKLSFSFHKLNYAVLLTTFSETTVIT